MNLKKVSLYGATLSVAMLGVSTTAVAVPVIYDPLAIFPFLYPPSATASPKAPVFPFANAEKSAICLSEALLSTMAAHISAKGCAAATTGGTGVDVDNDGNLDSVASFPVKITVDSSGKGTLTMSGGIGGLTSIELDNVLVDTRPTRGVKCLLSSPKNAGQFQIQGKAFNGFEGLYSWNANGAVLIGQAPRISIGTDWYSENIIKDFYNLQSAGSPFTLNRGGVLPLTVPAIGAGGVPTNSILLNDIQLPSSSAGALITIAATVPENINGDWGMESIMKHPYQGESYDDLGYPRSKWWQQSLHWNANGIGGGTQMKKTRLYPSYCNVELNLWGSDFASGFDESGVLRVSAVAPDSAAGAPVQPNLGLPNP